MVPGATGRLCCWQLPGVEISENDKVGRVPNTPLHGWLPAVLIASYWSEVKMVLSVVTRPGIPMEAPIAGGESLSSWFWNSSLTGNL